MQRSVVCLLSRSPYARTPVAAAALPHRASVRRVCLLGRRLLVHTIDTVHALTHSARHLSSDKAGSAQTTKHGRAPPCFSPSPVARTSTPWCGTAGAAKDAPQPRRVGRVRGQGSNSPPTHAASTNAAQQQQQQQQQQQRQQRPPTATPSLSEVLRRAANTLPRSVVAAEPEKRTSPSCQRIYESCRGAKASAPKPRSLPGGTLTDAVGVSLLDLDKGAEERVMAMLRSDHNRAHPGTPFVKPEPTLLHLPRSQLMRCALELPLPSPRDGGEEDNVNYAIGQSLKGKEARTLCFMHAEQLLDYHMSTRVSSSAPSSPPPPLFAMSTAATPRRPVQDAFTSWDAYVDACAVYVRRAATARRQRVYEKGEVPRGDHPIVDRAADLARDDERRSRTHEAMLKLNEEIKDASNLMSVMHLHRARVFVATVVLDAPSRLVATGVASKSKEARQRCAAHALRILQLVREDNARSRASPSWRKGRVADTGDVGGGGGGSGDASAALDSILEHLQPAERKLVQLYKVLFGEESMKPHVSFSQEEDTTTRAAVYRCHMTLNGLSCDGTGVNRFEAQRAAMNSALAHLTLCDDRLQAVQAFVGAHPSIAPDSIPSAALPTELLAQLQAQLAPVSQQQQQQREAAAAAVELTTAAKQSAAAGHGEAQGTDGDEGKQDRAAAVRGERALLQLSRRVFDASPAYAAEMQRALHAFRHDPVYLTHYHPRRSTLAMAAARTKLLDAIRKHPVTVVCGTTGCGKTTQVPQYILDDEIEHGRGAECNILVTQPRRLSSFSIAERIAQERLSTVGQDVGYAVRLDSRPGRHITICTTGVLLQMFTTSTDLEHVSHLIIDEVHERDIDCDVVLALVKQLLTRNTRLRVLLMSATLQADVFARYFGADTPVVQADGATYPVAIRYLEQIAKEAASVQFYSPAFDVVQQSTTSKSRSSSPSSSSSSSDSRRRENKSGSRQVSATRRPPKTDYNLIAYLVHRSVQVDLRNSTDGKSILVFLPGWKEQMAAAAAIRDYSGAYALDAAASRFHILLLHSTVDGEKQRECFVPAPAGRVKVVLATNIAESGITIDDAAVVIDTGLIKTTTWESRTVATRQHHRPAVASTASPSVATVSLDEISLGARSTAATAPAPVFTTQLTLRYASQANGTQRKGRAGRTQGGVCYRLYTKELWDSLPAFPEAAIHRVPLMQVLLKLLSLGHTDPRATMRTFLEPPSGSNVEGSLQLLRSIGAVSKGDQLTPLGEYLALLPCDPRIGKMIVLGTVLRCLDSVLTVAACTDVSPYVMDREEAKEARRRRYLLSRGSQSDHISCLNAYNAFCANGEDIEFARFNKLHLSNLRIISRYKKQYLNTLRDAGFIGADDDNYDGVEASETMVDGGSGSGGCSGGGKDGGALPSLAYPGTLCVNTSALSRDSFNVALVKACVCAALFPNVALWRPSTAARPQSRRGNSGLKVSLRTRTFHHIQASRDSACRRIGSPIDGGDATRDTRTPFALATLPSARDASPAFFYVYQDVFIMRESKQQYLTSLSAVSLWALLLFGASESTTEYHDALSICLVDGWIALRIDSATFALITKVRQCLFECLRRKCVDPKDSANNAALQTVTSVCRTILTAPVLADTPADADSADDGVMQQVQLSERQLVDRGTIVDPLTRLRHNAAGVGAAMGAESAAADVEDDDGDGDDDDGDGQDDALAPTQTDVEDAEDGEEEEVELADDR